MALQTALPDIRIRTAHRQHERKKRMEHRSAAWLAQLSTPGLDELRPALLVVLLVLAACIDVRTFRIPNWLTAGGAAIGLALGAAMQWRMLGPAWAVDGFLWSLGGLAAGLVLMLPMYALRVMGAGDVKLMAMAGAFLGLGQIVQAVLCVFVAGGVLAVGYSLWRRAFGRMTANVVDIVQSIVVAAAASTPPFRMTAMQPSVGKIPYGVSISAGTIAWIVLSRT